MMTRSADIIAEYHFGEAVYHIEDVTPRHMFPNLTLGHRQSLIAARLRSSVALIKQDAAVTIREKREEAEQRDEEEEEARQWRNKNTIKTKQKLFGTLNLQERVCDFTANPVFAHQLAVLDQEYTLHLWDVNQDGTTKLENVIPTDMRPQTLVSISREQQSKMGFQASNILQRFPDDEMDVTQSAGSSTELRHQLGRADIGNQLMHAGSGGLRQCPYCKALISQKDLRKHIFMEKAKVRERYRVTGTGSIRVEEMPRFKARLNVLQSVATSRQGQKLRHIRGNCDFGAHPQEILVMGKSQVHRIDLRAPTSPLSTLILECNTLNTVSHDNVCGPTESLFSLRVHPFQRQYFATVSTRHLSLYDCRYVKRPLLRWQHFDEKSPSNMIGFVSFSPSDLKRRGKSAQSSATSKNYAILLRSIDRHGILAFRYQHQLPSESSCIYQRGGALLGLDAPQIINCQDCRRRCALNAAKTLKQVARDFRNQCFKNLIAQSMSAEKSSNAREAELKHLSAGQRQCNFGFAAIEALKQAGETRQSEMEDPELWANGKGSSCNEIEVLTNCQGVLHVMRVGFNHGNNSQPESSVSAKNHLNDQFLSTSRLTRYHQGSEREDAGVQGDNVVDTDVLDVHDAAGLRAALRQVEGSPSPKVQHQGLIQEIDWNSDESHGYLRRQLGLCIETKARGDRNKSEQDRAEQRLKDFFRAPRSTYELQQFVEDGLRTHASRNWRNTPQPTSSLDAQISGQPTSLPKFSTVQSQPVLPSLSKCLHDLSHDPEGILKCLKRSQDPSPHEQQQTESYINEVFISRSSPACESAEEFLESLRTKEKEEEDAMGPDGLTDQGILSLDDKLLSATDHGEGGEEVEEAKTNSKENIGAGLTTHLVLRLFRQHFIA